MSVKVAFRQLAEEGDAGIARSQGVLIPNDAVRAEQGKDYVFVVREDRAERRAVSVVSTDAGQSLVTAGLSSGDQVVLRPTPNITDGTKVRVVGGSRNAESRR